MSAIDVAASTNSPVAASGKSKAGAADSDGNAFEQVYESVGRKSPDSKSSSGKAANTTQDKAESKTKTDTTNEDSAALSAQAAVADTGDLSSDLALLIGGGVTAQPSTDNNSTDKAASTPLRRDIISHLAISTDTDEDLKADPKSPRLTIIGRETHFAPVGIPQNDKAKATSSAMNTLITKSNDAPIEAEIAKATDVDGNDLISGDLKSQKVRPEAKESASTQNKEVKESASTQNKEAKESVSIQNKEVKESASTQNKITSELSTDRGKQTSTPSSAKAPIPSMTEAMMPSGTTGGVLTQIADQLIPHARDLASVSGQSNAAPASAPNIPTEQHGGGPVRILRLQLQPEELGMVTARLRIVGGVLELRLTADRQQSVELLQRDQEGLLETLRRAGYKAEIVSIDFARPLNSQQATGQQQTSNGSGQSFAGSHGSGGSGGFSDGSGRPAGEGQAQHQHSANNRYSEEHLTEGQNDGSGRQTRDPQSVYL